MKGDYRKWIIILQMETKQNNGRTTKILLVEIAQSALE